jgi:hypothetical protein
MSEKLSKIQYEIVGELCKSISLLGGKSDLIGTISSWGDTLPESEVLALIKVWNDFTVNELKERIELDSANYFRHPTVS